MSSVSAWESSALRWCDQVLQTFPSEHRKRARNIGKTCIKLKPWKVCRGQEEARDSADQENDKRQQICRQLP